VTRHRRDFLTGGKAMGFACAQRILRAAPHDAHVSDSNSKQRISDAHLQSRGADSARGLQSLARNEGAGNAGRSDSARSLACKNKTSIRV
jgi:hypothetical protein